MTESKLKKIIVASQDSKADEWSEPQNYPLLLTIKKLSVGGGVEVIKTLSLFKNRSINNNPIKPCAKKRK